MVWKKIGFVGVDSGQLIICDPSYIDSDWVKEDLKEQKQTLIHPNGKKEKVKHCSKRWFEVIDEINEGKIKVEGSIFKKAKNNFSYAACCQKTLEKSYGQLNYQIGGHPGVGTVFNTGFGDGVYEVFANIKKFKDLGERIIEIKVKFM